MLLYYIWLWLTVYHLPANPMIFKALQQTQFEAAKRKLSATPNSTQTLREFDVDIAKLL